MVALVATWVGLVAGVLTIGAIAMSSRSRRFIASHVPFHGFVFYRRRWSMNSVNGAIESAKREVSVLQTWLPTLNADIEHWEMAGDHVKTFRVLLASDELVSARRDCRPRVVALTGQNIEILISESRKHDRAMQIQRFSGIPFGPIYIVDDQVFWGLYLSNRDSLRGPMFRNSRHSYLGSLMVSSYEALWNSQTSVSVLGSAEIERSRGANTEVEPLETLELRPAQNKTTKYQRHCLHCNTWLNYRQFGPSGATETESYCPNPKCPEKGKRVESVHVS